MTTSTASRNDGTIGGEDLFPPQEKHVHASSIVECADGSLLACWFHGSGERRANDVLIQGARLRPGDTQWSRPFLMADTPGIPDCNPVLFIDARERLWLFWIAVLANRWECSLLKFRRAESYTSDGAPQWSWQDVIVLLPGEEFPQTIERLFREAGVREGMWGAYALPYDRMLVEAGKDKWKRQSGWMTRIHPLILPDGRILLPLYSDGFNLSLVAISDDEGETWRASLPIVGLGPIQPSLVRRRDGTIVAYLRDSGGPPQRVQISYSEDRGESWTFSRDLDIPNPGSSLEVIALDTGEWVMVGNDTEEGRQRLTAMLSDDEGATWSRRRAIEPSTPEAAFAYPSVIQTRDGRIHVTYSCRHPDRQECIRHRVFNAEWIRNGEA